jgi:hypothetical protein
MPLNYLTIPAQRTALAQEVATALTSAWEADPAAMHCLIINRVPCNQALEDHPFVGVDLLPAGPPTTRVVGMLGVINGMLRALGLPPICVQFSDVADAEGRKRIVGFAVAEWDGGMTRDSFFETMKQWVRRHEYRDPNVVRCSQVLLNEMRSNPGEWGTLEDPLTRLAGCRLEIHDGPLEFDLMCDPES